MKWEYKALVLDEEEPVLVTEWLNKLGEDGWELVLSDITMRIYIFKRPGVINLASMTDRDEKFIRKEMEKYFK